jgi:hypothetical protein
MPHGIHTGVVKSKDGTKVIDNNPHKTTDDRKKWYDDVGYSHFLQTRFSPNAPWLSPEGDLAHNYQQIAALAANQLKLRWSYVWKMMPLLGVSEEEVYDGFASYMRLLKAAAVDKFSDFEYALRESGWYDLRPEVEAIICGAFGRAMMVVQWHRMRAAALNSSSISASMEELFRSFCIPLKPDHDEDPEAP